MVSIKDFSLGELQRTRRRLRREVLVRHIAGEGVVALGPVLLRMLRVRRDVRCLMERVRGVSATTINLGTFSTEQALSLFRVKPADVGRVAGLLHLDDEVYPGRHRVSGIERLCIMLRRLSSPARWVDLDGALWAPQLGAVRHILRNPRGPSHALGGFLLLLARRPDAGAGWYICRVRFG